MSSQGIAVQDRLGDTTDHAMPPGDKPAPRGSGPFLYASGDKPLAGYVIKRGVGSGGFGEVYYATSDAGKEVAIKLIRRNLDTELRGMRQCLNVKHPNLLTLYDIRQDDSGDTWVVMEYMSGKCLEDELADHPHGLPLPEALMWFHGIAAGVAYLHDHGVVHRDLKPGNIFRDEGVVKVGDYGLSKFISCSRRSGHTESIGTVHYMAPEVAHGRYGKELDIYALGAILYELLTGRVPFDGESVGEVLMKHLTAQPDVSVLAEPFRGVVARAMEKDPARRFATVGQMAAALPAIPLPSPAGCTQPCGRGAGGEGAQFASISPRPNLFPTGVCSEETSQGLAGKPDVQPAPLGSCPDLPKLPPWPPLNEPIMADLAANVYTDQEPIAQFVALQLQKARQRWQAVDLHLGAKRLIVAGLIIFLLFTIGIWMPTAMFLLVVYGGYRVVRFFYRTFFRTASVAPPMARPVSTAKYVRPAAASEIPAPAFVIKPLVVRMGDLIGSLLAAAAVTGVMCLVMLLIATYRGMPLAVEQAAWLYLVSLVGAWLVLITAKVWEGSRGERMLRHFILMTIGLSLGLAAFGIAEGFLVRLPMDPDFGNVLKGSPLGYASQNGRPIAMAYVAAFATLLGLLRWWMDADPMRASRLSLGSLFVTVVIAHFIALAWQFPEPWLTMVAACMSVTVQLSSPWVPTYARLRPQRKKMV